MSVSNLHSLFSGKWFIDESYGKSLIPSLHAVLQGNTLSANNETAPFIFSASKKNMQPQAFLEGSSSDNEYVGIVSIKSPIYKYNQECGPAGTKTIMRRMQSFGNDDNCVGVVLDIDSGGGQVSGTPEFHDFISTFSKPVVSYTDGLMCSAAYYIASGANHIIANKRADAIGSIGVMIHFVDLNGYYEKLGANVITEYATKSTEKNKPFAELIKGNPEEYIRKELDPINEQFHEDIKTSRPNINTDVLKGATWNAKDSLELGLIDEIGTLQTAIDKVFELSNSNLKTNNTMSKNRAQVQAVLDLENPLAQTDNGSYLNEEQLDALESHLSAQNATIGTLQTDLEAAQNNTELQTQLTEATGSLSAAETSVDAMLEEAGLEVEGSFTEKLTALNAKVAVMAKKDGAQISKTKIDTTATEAENVILDATASHNKLADQINK